MNKLLFGTAGIPSAAKGTGTEGGIKNVRELGLDAMELEFVQSVNILPATAPKIKAAAAKENVTLTCHAPYYINLNAAEAEKIEASKKRLIKAAQVAEMCGGVSVAFHPGFYLGGDKEKVYETVKKELTAVVAELKNGGCKIWVRPETTGKRTQFGDLNEILRLCGEIEQVMPCIDYAHVHARESSNNTYGEFCEILAAVEKALGKEALKNMHIQIAGVNYNGSGERNHLNLDDSDLNYKDIIRSWKEFGIAGIVISESPNIEGDALMLKRLHED
ncbi:TIM barrel protein [Candidatus Woesearchaeota archaeon]|nr:TIM barrel protein [Candidatus Woesearchaeota archaeon]